MPRKVAVLFLLQLFLATSLLAQQDNEQITRYLEQARTVRGTPGISYTVALEGKLVYSGGVGYADLNNMVPATAATVHNVGSVSKVNVVVAVMQLVENGTVDLDVPIQTYLPSFPHKRWPVTLRHVMTHTSGIRHYNPDDFGDDGAENKNHFEAAGGDTVLQFSRDGDHQTLAMGQGLIWRVSRDAQGRQFIQHSGAVRGFRTYLLNYVELDLVVAVIGNYQRVNSGRYAKAIAQLFLPPHPAGTR